MIESNCEYLKKMSIKNIRICSKIDIKLEIRSILDLNNTITKAESNRCVFYNGLIWLVLIKVK